MFVGSCVCCALFDVRCGLPVVCCLMVGVRCSLVVACCLLFIAWCVLSVMYVVRRVPSVV